MRREEENSQTERCAMQDFSGNERCSPLGLLDLMSNISSNVHDKAEKSPSDQSPTQHSDCCPSMAATVEAAPNELIKLERLDIEYNGDPELEIMKQSLENLTYNVDSFYAFDPSLIPRVGGRPAAAAWSIKFCEDSRKLTFRREVRVRKTDQVKARKRKRGRTKQEETIWRPPVGGVEWNIMSDDLEDEDDLLAKPEWSRQYRSINALVS